MKYNFKHGQKITCEIERTKITDAKISINKDGTPYICQNQKDGYLAEDKLGYIYSFKLEKDFTGLYVTNLLPAEITWDTLDEGDMVILEDGEHEVLAKKGKMIWLSISQDFTVYMGAYTKEHLIRNDATIKQPEQLNIDELKKKVEEVMKEPRYFHNIDGKGSRYSTGEELMSIIKKMEQNYDNTRKNRTIEK